MLDQRRSRSMETYNQHIRSLQDVKIGGHALVQNQTGNQPTRWDKTGLVTEVLPHDQDLIHMDGSGRSTLIMAEWSEQASQRHEMHCHDREVLSLDPSLVELGVHSTSVLHRTGTKKTVSCQCISYQPNRTL